MSIDILCHCCNRVLGITCDTKQVRVKVICMDCVDRKAKKPRVVDPNLPSIWHD